MKTLFLTLRTFSATGGIEKVCRILGKALYESAITYGGSLQVCSMYDKQKDAFGNTYFPTEYFRGYSINKLLFIKDMIGRGKSSDVVILSHINLLLVGWIIKKLRPSVKLMLLAHGIEIWYAGNRRRSRMLQACDVVLCVSAYTQEKIIEVHKVKRENCKVLNNCLDPFLSLPSIKKKNEFLLKKYDLSSTDIVAMSLTRISSKERYKGYEKVIEAISMLEDRYTIKYLIAGAYDKVEKKYLDDVIQKLNVQDRIIMPGFIPNDELEDHFFISDMYVMPSRKEGFGIVFIEAMYYGLPVIAGNTDGSVDALLGGRLGQLVDPENVESIAAAISNIIETRSGAIPSHKILMDHFSYESYKRNLETII